MDGTFHAKMDVLQQCKNQHIPNLSISFLIALWVFHPIFWATTKKMRTFFTLGIVDGISMTKKAQICHYVIEAIHYWWEFHQYPPKPMKNPNICGLLYIFRKIPRNFAKNTFQKALTIVPAFFTASPALSRQSFNTS